MTSPRVSVLMPVRNGEAWLAAAIDSVLAQTLSDFELLVIDDGSTDRTAEIIAAYVARDARIRPLPQASLGLVAALNNGLTQARGDLIARLDADDLAGPARLATQVAAMDANGRLVLLGSWAEIIDSDGHVTGRLTPESDPQMLRALLHRTNPIIHSSIMMRTDAARRSGGYRAAFEAAEDYDLWLRLSEQGDIGILPLALVSYREHGGNVTARKAARQLFSTRIAIRAAAARRRTGIDPAASLNVPPDWQRDAADAFLAQDLRLLRLLELADPAIAASADGNSIEFDAALESDLNHRERKQAQLAVLNILRTGRATPIRAARFFWQLIRLHPSRAIKLLAHHFMSR